MAQSAFAAPPHFATRTIETSLAPAASSATRQRSAATANVCEVSFIDELRAVLATVDALCNASGHIRYRLDIRHRDYAPARRYPPPPRASHIVALHVKRRAPQRAPSTRAATCGRDA